MQHSAKRFFCCVGYRTQDYPMRSGTWHDLTPEKIEVAFRLIHPVMECIKDNNGGNNFKIPHSGIRKQMRSEGWDI